MSIKACYANGVFTPLEETQNTLPGAEQLAWLRATGGGFAFWDNEEDAAYDRL